MLVEFGDLVDDVMKVWFVECMMIDVGMFVFDCVEV